MGIVDMPLNYITGLYNVTHEEVEKARQAPEDVTGPKVREDGTLTLAGQIWVAEERRLAYEIEEDSA